MPITWPPNASAFAGSNSLLVTPAVVVAVAVIGRSFLSMTAMLVFKRLLHIGETTGHKNCFSQVLTARIDTLLTPNVVAAPCAEPERKRYSALSWNSPTFSPASSMNVR